jgi:Fe-S-cluster-containing dehydrogenase component
MMEFFLDPGRCIGCRACVQACSECDTHKGHPMIHLEFLDRAASTQTAPAVCMHCDPPTCAEVCPADAIKRGEDGVVRSALKARCVGCSNCVLACPFGIPKMHSDFDLMMKCDLCYDRTSIGKKPMCASVCPSGALFYGSRADIERLRPRATPLDRFQFGGQTITTRVHIMVPRSAPPALLNITAALDGPVNGQAQAAAIDRLDAALYQPDVGPHAGETPALRQEIDSLDAALYQPEALP